MEITLLKTGDGDFATGLDSLCDPCQLGIHVIEKEDAEGADCCIKIVDGKA